MDKQQPTLSLRVINSDKLESGKQASHLFHLQGGTVGSDVSHPWSIQDQSGSVHASAFAIEWRDGAFCLRVLNDAITINQSVLTVKSGFVLLQQGDEIALSTLTFKCHIAHSDAGAVDPLTVSPESLVSNYNNPLEAMMEGGESRVVGSQQEARQASTVVNGFSSDPLRVLETESLTTRNNFTASSDIDQLLHQDRYRSPLAASPLSDSSTAMEQEYVDLPHITPYRAAQNSEPDHKLAPLHVAITPLMRGFDAQLPIRNSQDANDFLEEAGKTLKATIEGLLALQRSQHGLRDKHLRPLEDNPLRLNMDYDTTLSLLFADGKSPVHLAAPAAVAESLHNLRLHHQANQQAITQALNTMLEAFSPERLLTRFTHYLRSNERQERDSAWAWEMYKNYYQELSSSRQQGFEKLFGEVYAQAYDQALRQGMKDSE
ncbi:type VI secretion system-associated FHA domain protein TagH [Scandinavium manionii]|uniref:type VI secretion system-associated FHA domain protein TagH n=1 Tax=Scandinavium manionii TaxID=2926520 RepID=UPI0021650B84|nr:type VI secretion system-associated FHA domain protein TagH [Scandinavium manionii]MCS2167896.1 type VI secretion system-associated FHA domain protein TagH [Scandinavium manionii]